MSKFLSIVFLVASLNAFSQDYIGNARDVLLNNVPEILVEKISADGCSSKLIELVKELENKNKMVLKTEECQRVRLSDGSWRFSGKIYFH